MVDRRQRMVCKGPDTDLPLGLIFQIWVRPSLH
jgi:hypothetical protein